MMSRLTQDSGIHTESSGADSAISKDIHSNHVSPFRNYTKHVNSDCVPLAVRHCNTNSSVRSSHSADHSRPQQCSLNHLSGNNIDTSRNYSEPITVFSQQKFVYNSHEGSQREVAYSHCSQNCCHAVDPGGGNKTPYVISGVNVNGGCNGACSCSKSRCCNIFNSMEIRTERKALDECTRHNLQDIREKCSYVRSNGYSSESYSENQFSSHSNQNPGKVIMILK